MRRVALWTSVCCLSLLALCSAAQSLALRLFSQAGSGWTFYTPYSTTPTADRIIEATSLVTSILYPITLLALAAYLILTERANSSRIASRGFEVVDR